jgi:beta-hydroxylase
MKRNTSKDKKPILIVFSDIKNSFHMFMESVFIFVLFPFVFGILFLISRDKLSTVAFMLLKRIERLIARYSPHGNSTFIESTEFPWTKELEKNWKDIRQELDVILKYRSTIPNLQDIAEDQKSLTTDDKWKTFFLYGYGFSSDKNVRLCPKTSALLQKIPGMKTAMFSILDGDKHIPPHRGPYKGVLRYHMGLKVPEPDKCTIRVGTDYAHWYEGKSMIFDDTHNHEVWNKSERQRVVLFVDFVRPLPFPLSITNKFLIYLISISPFVQDIKKKQSKWDGKLNEAINNKTTTVPDSVG